MSAHKRSDEEYIALMRARASMITILVARNPIKALTIAERAKRLAWEVERRNERGVLYEKLSLLNTSSRLYEIYWEIEREISHQYPPF